MGSLFVKYFDFKHTTMYVGERYVLKFKVLERKPESNFEEIDPDEDFFLQIEGEVDGTWTQKLQQLIKPGMLSIRLTPPENFAAANVWFKVTILDEEGDIVYTLYEKNIQVKEKTARTGSEPGPIRTTEIPRETRLTLITFQNVSLLENFGVLYVTYSGDELLLYAQQIGEKNIVYSTPKHLSNIRQLSLDVYIKAQYPFDTLSGLGKALFHGLDPKIIEWIIALLKKHSQPPNLLIYDSTDYEIPWELIYMEPSEEEKKYHGFLGTLASVARWINVQREGHLIPPDFSEEQSCGSLLSYIPKEPHFLRNLEDEIQAVKNCGFCPFESPGDILAALEEERTDVVFIHFASHGSFEPDTPQNSGIRFPKFTLSSLMLNNREMKLIRKSRPVIFINACHSGRSSQLGWTIEGINIPFLRKDANGLIGVMGRVRSKSAAYFAKCLLEAIQQEQPDSIAEILRKFREKAVREAQRAPIDKQKALLDAFMYVYYGNPLKAIRIIPQK